MPLTLIEDNESRSATIHRLGKKATSTHTRSYKLIGSSDDQEIHQYLFDNIPVYWQYPTSNVQLRFEYYSVEYLGDDAWHVTVYFEKEGAEPESGGGDDEQNAPLHRSRQFDTGGGTQHITQSIGGQRGNDNTTPTETRFPNNAADMSGAIGVDGSSVQGVDVVVPMLQWSETYDVFTQYVTDAYVKKVANLTGTVNKSAFRSFAAGEVLFLGASGSQEYDTQKGNGPWTITYKFAASPNVTNRTIGNITGISKKGHEYLWVRYEDDVAGNSLIKKPKAVYVDKVYPEAEFSQLGIGP